MDWADIAARMGHALFPADAAVVVFLALSGYVLTLSLDRVDEGPAIELVSYAVRRAFRLLPVAMVAALPYAFLREASLAAVIGTMFFADLSLNAVVWTMQIEVGGSAFVFWLWAVGRWSRWFVWLWALASIVLALSVENYFAWYAPAFALGALAVRHGRAGFWRSPAVALAALAAILLARPVFGHWRAAILIESVASAALVGCVARQSVPWLLSRPVRFLGAVSYPFYLLHGAALAGAERLVPLPPAIALAPLYAALSIPAALVAAGAVHRLVEVPANRVGHRLSRSISRRTTSLIGSAGRPPTVSGEAPDASARQADGRPASRREGRRGEDRAPGVAGEARRR